MNHYKSLKTLANLNFFLISPLKIFAVEYLPNNIVLLIQKIQFPIFLQENSQSLSFFYVFLFFCQFTEMHNNSLKPTKIHQLLRKSSLFLFFWNIPRESLYFCRFYFATLLANIICIQWESAILPILLQNLHFSAFWLEQTVSLIPTFFIYFFYLSILLLSFC